MKKPRDYLSLSIKLILLISIINAISEELWHIMSTNIFLLILMFIPKITKKYDIKIPKSFEWALLVFVIFTLFVGKIGTIIAPLVFGISVGFIGLMILAILYSSNQIKKNYLLITLFSFNFALAFGVILELLKYYLKIILGHDISQNLHTYSMQNLTFVLIGALIAVLIGFVYMKGYFGWVKKIFNKLIDLNPTLLKKKDEEEILELIEKGENEKLEFKSTLRVNLHTQEIDKKIEHSVLKTIVAFLNSGGGTLLIGVSNERKILGIEKDKFENEDKFLLHLLNIIKEKIGKKYLDLIEIKLLRFEQKIVVKISCRKSNKEIFLKTSQKEEEFYVRTGNATTNLYGSELVDYIEKNFRKNI